MTHMYEITTAAELNELPEEDVLLRASGRFRYTPGTFTDLWVRPLPSWMTHSPERVWEVMIVGGELPLTSVLTEDLDLPVAVLYRPADETEAPFTVTMSQVRAAKGRAGSKRTEEAEDDDTFAVDLLSELGVQVTE